MNISKLMQQAQKVQDQMKKIQEQQEKLEVIGESGAGLIKVKMTGKHGVKSVKIDSDLLTEEKEILEDLLAAAVNDAVRRIEEKNKDSMSCMTQDFNLPTGFKI